MKKSLRTVAVLVLSVMVAGLISGCNPETEKAANALYQFYAAVDQDRYADAWNLLSNDSKEYLLHFVKYEMDGHPELSKLESQIILDEFVTGKGKVPTVYWSTFKEQLPWEKMKNASWKAVDSNREGYATFIMDGDANWSAVAKRENDGQWYYVMPRG